MRRREICSACSFDDPGADIRPQSDGQKYNPIGLCVFCWGDALLGELSDLYAFST